MTTAYSYVRFSTEDQASGDSLRRQTDLDSFCGRHNLTLSDATYHDLGVSAFKGKNKDQGALGAFLQAVKEGKISKGSVLIIEQLDRLTRIEPDEAAHLFGKIIRAGVKIGHLRKNRILDKDCLKGIAFLELSVELCLANEESGKKSERILQAMATHQTKAREGKIWTSKGPAWLKLSDDRKKWLPIPAQVKKVKLIFKLAKTMGVQAIAQKLVVDGVEPLNYKSWNRTAIRNLLRSRTVLSEYQPTSGKDTKGNKARVNVGDPIKGYYGKPVIDEATFHTVQQAINSRANATGGRTATTVNVLSGLLKDKATGSTMYVHSRPQKDGSKRKEIYPASSNNGQGGFWSTHLDTVEKAVLLAVKEVRLDDDQNEEESELEGLKAKAETLKANMAKLQDTLATADDFASGLQLMRKMEADTRATETAIETAQAALNSKPADRLRAAQTAIDALEEDNGKDTRLALRSQLRGLIDSIVISKVGHYWVGQPSSENCLALDIHYKSEKKFRLVLVDLDNLTICHRAVLVDPNTTWDYETEFVAI